jgi:UDP-N-acetylglucosamine:LPS N-acetylglucosamine transferase
VADRYQAAARHNQCLGEQLSAMKLPFPRHVEGFTRDISRLMQLSDYFVGKPGPGSVSEALVMNLPVIVERNARTMVQERYNTEWIERHQFGVVLGSFNEIVTGIKQMLEPRRFAHFRSSVGVVNNRAVFEIPDLLEELIAAGPGESEPAAFQAPA